MRAGREGTIEKAKETFEEALNKVLPATKTVVEKLRDMGNKPDEIEVTFGIAAMVGARNDRQVLISAGSGLFCGGTQRTALLMRQSTSVSPSSVRARYWPLAKPYSSSVE